MGFIVSLHKRQILLPSGETAANARLYFYENITSTQVSVFSDESCDAAFEYAQPVICNDFGVMPPVFTVTNSPIRIYATDEDDVALDGYPMDWITPEDTTGSAAEDISFSPTDDLPFTTVQEAIEGAAALSTDQTALNARAFTPYVTGGSLDAYTLTPAPAIVAYQAGQSFTVRPHVANTTTTPTLNINGLGSRDWRKIGSDGNPTSFAVGEIQLYREMQVYDDGTRILGILGRDNTIFGSSSNGSWTLGVDGTLICRKRALMLEFSDVNNLAAIWTFPKAFTSTTDLAVTATYAGGDAIADPGLTFTSDTASMAVRSVAAVVTQPLTTTTCVVRAFRVSGAATGFEAGDEIYVSMTAIGRGI